MKNKLGKTFLVLLLAASALCLLWWYGLNPRGITQYTNKTNAILSMNSNVIVPVLVATTRYDIPAPYLRHVGFWHPDKEVYGSPLTMEVKGTDFSPASLDANPDGSEKILTVSMTSIQQIRDPAAKSSLIDKRKKIPKTLEEFDADVTTGMYPLPLVRAPELDKSGWVAYRGGYRDETYVAPRALGGVFVFSCTSDEKNLLSLCFIYHEENSVHIEYFFAKKHIADAEHFYIGLIKLINSFKHK